ncbi:MAG: hypothetical protein HUJ72_00395 [Blautia sp.]|nr:hypothetical protein [Blautia sp.]
MYYKTLLDQNYEQYDSELVNDPEYQKLRVLSDSIMKEFISTLSDDQKTMFLDVEESMNNMSAYSSEFYFRKGYELGIINTSDPNTK